MPIAATDRFGALAYDDSATIAFPRGLPGFDRLRQFVLIDQAAHAPVIFLQSLEIPGLCFLTLPLRAVDPQYELAVVDEDLETLQLDQSRQPVPGEELLCLAIVAAAKNGLTANLLAPILVNLRTHLALQAVRSDSRYSHCHALGAQPC